VTALRVTGRRIVLPEAPDDRAPDIRVWVFQGAGVIETPRAAPLEDHVAALVARHAPARLDVASTDTRLYSLPVAHAGQQIGAVVAGVSLAPYEQTRSTALIGSMLLSLAAFVALALAASWLISRALRPVATMTRQAAEWSEHDLDRRFAQGPPRDELTQLAFTLDGLLDRLAASLRHEQRLSAELSHELRTPLANIAAQAQYALRHGKPTPGERDTLERILDSTHQMSRTLDTLIAAARAQLDPNRTTSDATECARAATAACQRLASEQGVRITISGSEVPPRVAVEQDLVQRILSPVIENACRHAIQDIRVGVGRDGAAIQFAIEDDGPGIPYAELEAIFEPGWQGVASGGTTTLAAQSAGLGLALSRRLARTAGGDVRAQPSEHGGRFTIRLPGVSGVPDSARS
jgi:two-component system, OmpR family, sensor kinase